MIIAIIEVQLAVQSPLPVKRSESRAEKRKNNRNGVYRLQSVYQCTTWTLQELPQVRRVWPTGGRPSALPYLAHPSC